MVITLCISCKKEKKKNLKVTVAEAVHQKRGSAYQATHDFTLHQRWAFLWGVWWFDMWSKTCPQTSMATWLVAEVTYSYSDCPWRNKLYGHLAPKKVLLCERIGARSLWRLLVFFICGQKKKGHYLWPWHCSDKIIPCLPWNQSMIFLVQR